MGYTGKQQEILMKAWALQDISVSVYPMCLMFYVFLPISVNFMPAFGLKYFKAPLCFFHFVTVPDMMLSTWVGLKN